MVKYQKALPGREFLVRLRLLLIGLASLLGLFIIAQLLLTIWVLQPDWFHDPMAIIYGSLWVLAGLTGLSAAFRPPRGVPAAVWERLPWLAAGVLWGFVGPGIFSVGAHLFFSGSLILLAAALRTPRKRYALEALLTAMLTTGVVLGIAFLTTAAHPVTEVVGQVTSSYKR